MRRTHVFALALVGLLAIFTTAQVAEAQLHMIAQKDVADEIVVTPTDPTIGSLTDSPELIAFEVPPVPTAKYLLLSTSSTWRLTYTGGSPVNANLRLRFTVTSPALPAGVLLVFSHQLIYLENSVAQGIQSETSQDSEPLTRQYLQSFLQAENPSLTNASAKNIIDNMFRQGFHISVIERLRSQNIASGSVVGTNIAIFAETSSQNSQ